MRSAKPGSGKRGGLRVIDYWAPKERAFSMIYAYSKNQHGFENHGFEFRMNLSASAQQPVEADGRA